MACTGGRAPPGQNKQMPCACRQLLIGPGFVMARCPPHYGRRLTGHCETFAAKGWYAKRKNMARSRSGHSQPNTEKNRERERRASGGHKIPGVENTKLLDDKDVLRLLREDVDRAGGQSAWARRSGIDRTHLSRVLKGKRPLSPTIVQALKLKRVVAY
jgi:hypothetical protein